MRTESITINDGDVRPLTPIAPYLGSKRLLAKTIVPIIEQIPHHLYAEPFLGMGGLFFRRTKRPKCEAINNINSEIINLFRMVEKFPDYLADMLKFKICSRAEFKQMLATPPQLLTELERAVRYLYIQKNAFGGQTQSQSFGIATERAGDPPYWDCETDYGKGIFSKADFETLAKLLKNIRGKFIMSLNDVPEIRRIFKSFYIKEVQTIYTIGLQSGKKASELLLSNVNLNNL